MVDFQPFFVPCLARYRVFEVDGIVKVFENQSACDFCNSRGCWISCNYQPVSKWKCYPKSMENNRILIKKDLFYDK